MALAANAAYQTTAKGFAVDTLSCHFLAAPDAKVPFDITVQQLNDGGRFCSRVATLHQSGSLKVHVTCSFVRPSSMTGSSMTHSVQRRSHQKIDAITLDDLAPGRTDIGPYMKFQRLPLLCTGPANDTPSDPQPEHLLYTSAAQISPLGTSDDRSILHHLALIALSDYHILDCPPTVHGRAVGKPDINAPQDQTQPIDSDFTFMTSLNHSIRFHAHDGFRTDEVLYVEANCPWTRGRRAQVDSRIFCGAGRLLATCAQGAYFVMKGEAEQREERRWVMDKEAKRDGEKSRL